MSSNQFYNNLNNWWILFVVGAVRLSVRSYRSHDAKPEFASQIEQRLIVSVEAQNQAYLHGHQFGTQGHFPTQGCPTRARAPVRGLSHLRYIVGQRRVVNSKVHSFGRTESVNLACSTPDN